MPIAATYNKQASETNIILPEVEVPAISKDAYLLISDGFDTPDYVARTYTKQWRIEAFYRAAKQSLGLTSSCYAQSELAHFAHVELVFTAKTHLCYAAWECNKEGAEQALSLRSDRVLFNDGCRIRCCNQQI
ncbi:hypothetical protein ABDB91_12945 [Desulfoscipio sp. XC116]|uniref:hypothetical protein n=1 Tax=Desulfoscipio sp. XC116 TaxID=3144975 RepID=UPI00325B84D3